MNSSSDSIERIRQGLLTMETIISTFDVDTTASNFQPIATRTPLTVTTTASNTETSAAVASGKSIRHSAVSPTNNTDTPLSGTNYGTDGSGSKVNHDAPLSISDSLNSLKGSKVFEKAAGVGLLNSNSNSSSTHGSGSDSQREIENHIMNKEELGSSNLEEDAVDASNEFVITHLSEESPSRGTADLKSEAGVGAGVGAGAGTLKGAASEQGIGL